MEGFSNRLQDVEEGIVNVHPIPYLPETPIVSLEQAVERMDQYDLKFTRNLRVHVKTALTFARNMKLEEHLHIKSCPAIVRLSVDEIASIQLYTQESPFYRVLNENLRNQNRSILTPFLPYIKLFLSALYKLPVVSSIHLYRGVKKNLASDYPKPCPEKIWWAFSSCTKHLSVLQDFVSHSGNSTIFTIIASHAYDISTFSAMAEAEYLLPPNTVLSVKGMVTSGSVAMIEMMQQEYVHLFDPLPSEVPSFNEGAHASPLKNTSISPPAEVKSLSYIADVSSAVQHQVVQQPQSNQGVCLKSRNVKELLSMIRRNRSNAEIKLCALTALEEIIENESEQIMEIAEAKGIDLMVELIRADVGNADVVRKVMNVSRLLCRGSSFQVLFAEAGGIEAVITAMSALASNVDVQQSGCWTLLTVTFHPSNRTRVAQGGGIQVVVEAMRFHLMNEDLQVYGSWALMNIALDPENQLLLAAEGAIEAVVSAMRKYITNADLQQYGCGVLLHIAKRARNKKLLAEKGAIEAVVVAMNLHLQNEDIQHYGCWALDHVSAHYTVKGPFLHRRGIDATLLAMRTHALHRNIQEYGCHVLDHVVIGVGGQELVAQKGVAVIVAAMKNFLSNGDLQGCACRVLRNMACNNEYAVCVANSGGIEAVLASMKAHPHHNQVQAFGCWALQSIAKDAQNQVREADAGAIAVIIAAMQGNRGNVKVQHHGCGALQNIARHSLNQARVVHEGGIAAAISAMEVCPSEKGVQVYGCGVLLNLAAHTHCRELIAKEGGVKAVVTAMRNHPLDQAVQHFGCWALQNIGQSSETQSHIAQKKGIDAIITGMRAHPSNTEVQHYGCGALLSSSSNDENKKLIAKLGGTSTVIDAMRAHPTNASIQEKGCGTLVNISSVEKKTQREKWVGYAPHSHSGFSTRRDRS